LSIALVKSIDPSAATSPHKEIKGRPGSLARPLTPQTVDYGWICSAFSCRTALAHAVDARVVPMIFRIGGRFPERSGHRAKRRQRPKRVRLHFKGMLQGKTA
jgi:hypothetical protein